MVSLCDGRSPSAALVGQVAVRKRMGELKTMVGMDSKEEE